MRPEFINKSEVMVRLMGHIEEPLASQVQKLIESIDRIPSVKYEYLTSAPKSLIEEIEDYSKEWSTPDGTMFTAGRIDAIKDVKEILSRYKRDGSD